MYEEVRGTIIGEITFPYQFWTVGDNPQKIAQKFFRNDATAIEWFRKNYSEHLEGEKKVEMRVFDKV